MNSKEHLGSESVIKNRSKDWRKFTDHKKLISKCLGLLNAKQRKSLKMSHTWSELLLSLSRHLDMWISNDLDPNSLWQIEHSRKYGGFLPRAWIGFPMFTSWINYWHGNDNKGPLHLRLLHFVANFALDYWKTCFAKKKITTSCLSCLDLFEPQTTAFTVHAQKAILTPR